jgi:hypothetical protein
VPNILYEHLSHNICYLDYHTVLILVKSSLVMTHRLMTRFRMSSSTPEDKTGDKSLERASASFSSVSVKPPFLSLTSIISGISLEMSSMGKHIMFLCMSFKTRIENKLHFLKYINSKRYFNQIIRRLTNLTMHPPTE